jgi:hypothetical protein
LCDGLGKNQEQEKAAEENLSFSRRRDFRPFFVQKCVVVLPLTEN